MKKRIRLRQSIWEIKNTFLALIYYNKKEKMLKNRYMKALKLMSILILKKYFIFINIS